MAQTIRVRLPRLHAGRPGRAALDARWAPGVRYKGSGQQEIFDSPARFKVLFCGKRWGKSRFVFVWLLAAALMGKYCWWLWPNQVAARRGWDDLKKMVQKVPGVVTREVERMVIFAGGGYIQIKSAHEPDTLRGEPVHRCAFSEASYMRHGEYIWSQIISNQIADYRGEVLFETSCRGFDWVWALAVQTEGLAEWEWWRIPSWDNPHLDIREIERLAATTSPDKFRAEICAESFADAAMVLGDPLRACVLEEGWRYEGDVAFICGGLDLARHVDYTALSIMDGFDQGDERLGESARQAGQFYLERWQGLEWDALTEQVRQACLENGVECLVVDSTGVGDVMLPQIEDALGADCEVLPFVFGTKSKTALVKDFALALQKGRVRLLNHPALIGEMQDFRGKRNSQTLHVAYEAEHGHDDLVIASALNWWGMVEGEIGLG